MIVSAHRLRSVGWIALLAVCAALVMVLAFRVNALRSQVHRSEQRIVALRQEKMYLETEFETRANQQQLKAWNDVEFGYVAPGANQYLENERQLASLSKPAEPDAPAPIRVASMDDSVVAAAAFPSMVSPLSGKPVAQERPASDANEDHVVKLSHAAATAALSARLGTVDHARTDADSDKPAKKRADKTVENDGAKASVAAKAKAKVKAAADTAKSATKTPAAKKPVVTKLAAAKPATKSAATKSGTKIASTGHGSKDVKTKK